MKELSFTVVTDIAKCHLLWEQFSPKHELFDLWNLRYTRFKHYDADPYFLVGYHNGRAVGILPLQWDRNREMLQIFGRAVCSGNNIWLAKGYKQCYKQFYDQIADNRASIALGGYQKKYKRGFIKKSPPKFMLRVKEYEDYHQYMEDRWREKDRRKIEKEIRKLESTYRIETKQATTRMLDKLFDLNIKRFGDRSSYTENWVREMNRNIVKYFETDVLVVKVNGKIEAVGLSVIYNGVYYGLNSGSNRAINNLGKYLYLKKIQRAIDLNMEYYHAGRGDYGNWKTTFGFATLPHHTFVTPKAKEAGLAEEY